MVEIKLQTIRLSFNYLGHISNEIMIFLLYYTVLKLLLLYLVLNDQIEKKEEEIADVRKNIKRLEDYRVQ